MHCVVHMLFAWRDTHTHRPGVTLLSVRTQGRVLAHRDCVVLTPGHHAPGLQYGVSVQLRHHRGQPWLDVLLPELDHPHRALVVFPVHGGDRTRCSRMCLWRCVRAGPQFVSMVITMGIYHVLLHRFGMQQYVHAQGTRGVPPPLACTRRATRCERVRSSL